MAAMLYAAGFVVVSAALARYGVRELEAVRPRYITVGLAFCFITLGIGLAAGWAIPLAARLWNRRQWLRIPGAVGALAVLVFAAYGLAVTEQYILSQAQPVSSFSLTGWLSMLPPFGRYNSSVLLILVLLRRAGWHRELSAQTVTHHYVTVAMGAALAAILSYATSVYPILPTWLGGGLPENVRIELAHPLESCAACMTTDLQLIDEDNLRLILLKADGTALEVNRLEVRSLSHR